jgi:hypothetical protein
MIGGGPVIGGGGDIPIIGEQEQWQITPVLKFIGNTLCQMVMNKKGHQKWVNVPREPPRQEVVKNLDGTTTTHEIHGALDLNKQNL